MHKLEQALAVFIKPAGIVKLAPSFGKMPLDQVAELEQSPD